MTATALVTGGTDGVGFSLARALAREGFDVHVVGSNPEKGARVEAQLRSIAAGEGGSATVTFWCVDLSDPAAIVAFTERFRATVTLLDRLVFSAGVVLPSRQETAQGIEKTFAINFLSAYLVADRVKELLWRAENPRVLLVSGGKGFALGRRLDFEDLQLRNHYSAPKAAIRAIHAKTVLAQILATDWKAKGVRVNAVHPGAVRSSLGRHLPWPLDSAFRMAARALPEDSASGIRVLLSAGFADVSACYVSGSKRTPLAFDEDYCGKLRRASDELIASAMPRRTTA